MDLDDFYDEMLVTSVDIGDVEEVREISPITNEELIQTQFTDAYCRDLRDSLESGRGPRLRRMTRACLSESLLLIGANRLWYPNLYEQRSCT